MPVTRVEVRALKKFKPGWRRDTVSGLWYTYQLDYTDPETGLRKRRRGFHSKDEAERFLRSQIAGAEMKRLGLVASDRTFPEIRDVLQRSISDLPSKRARTRATTVFRAFLSMLPDGFTVGDLRTKHYKDYADSRLYAGVKAETVNRETAFVRAALRRAHLNFPSLEEWTPPKCYRVPPTTREKRQRAISPEEERKILDVLRRKREIREEDRHYEARIRTACIFEFALMTGLRHGEISSIKKEDVKKNELSVYRSKTKVWTTFPLNDALRRILDEAVTVSRSEYVFSTRGIVMGKTDNLLREACEAAGVPYGKDVGVTLHSTRHTFITRMLHAGVDIATIQSFSSHTDASMVMRYSHATDESRRKALGKVTGEERMDPREIWERVRSGKMSFSEFKRKI